MPQQMRQKCDEIVIFEIKTIANTLTAQANVVKGNKLATQLSKMLARKSGAIFKTTCPPKTKKYNSLKTIIQMKHPF